MFSINSINARTLQNHGWKTRFLLIFQKFVAVKLPGFVLCCIQNNRPDLTAHSEHKNLVSTNSFERLKAVNAAKRQNSHALRPLVLKLLAGRPS